MRLQSGTLLIKTLIDQIDAIQKRVLRIIYSCTSDMSYTIAHYIALPFPVSHTVEEHFAQKFLKSVLGQSSCLSIHFAYRTGCLYHNSTNIHKQVPSHPHPYQKNTKHLSLMLGLIINMHAIFINCLIVCFSPLHILYSMRSTQTLCIHLGLLLFCNLILFYCAIWSHDHHAQ